MEAPTKPKPAAKWSCPVCMVSNDVSALSCVCCGEPQPGCKPAPKQDKKLPESTFSFGAPAGGGITFGAPKTGWLSYNIYFLLFKFYTLFSYFLKSIFSANNIRYTQHLRLKLTTYL